MTDMNRWLGVTAAFAVLPLMMAAGGASAPAHPVPPVMTAAGRASSAHLAPQQASGAITWPTSGGSYMAAAYSKSDGVVWMVTGDSSSDAQVNALYACDTLRSEEHTSELQP